MLAGGEAMTTKPEEVMDLAVAGEALLGLPRWLEALHVSTALGCAAAYVAMWPPLRTALLSLPVWLLSPYVTSLVVTPR